MSYILKQYDTDLLRFDMQKDIDGVSRKTKKLVAFRFGTVK